MLYNDYPGSSERNHHIDFDDNGETYYIQLSHIDWYEYEYNDEWSVACSELKEHIDLISLNIDCQLLPHLIVVATPDSCFETGEGHERIFTPTNGPFGRYYTHFDE